MTSSGEIARHYLCSHSSDFELQWNSWESDKKYLIDAFELPALHKPMAKAFKIPTQYYQERFIIESNVPGGVLSSCYAFFRAKELIKSPYNNREPYMNRQANNETDQRNDANNSYHCKGKNQIIV